MIDDYLNLGFELAAFIDELDVEGYPASDSAGTVEAGSNIHAHRPGGRRVLLVRSGRGRLHTS